jgi:hypothetical protein
MKSINFVILIGIIAEKGIEIKSNQKSILLCSFDQFIRLKLFFLLKKEE